MYMQTPVLLHFKVCVLYMNLNTHLGHLSLLTYPKNYAVSQYTSV